MTGSSWVYDRASRFWLPLLLTISLTGMSQSANPFASETECPKLSFSNEWHVLGPFRIGTREAVWGADPLEAAGGFHSITFHADSRYSSPLAKNATVGWSNTSALVVTTVQNSSADLTFDFPHVDWQFAQLVFGWSALQYQAWARGQLVNHGSQPLKAALHTNQILEFWVNDEHFFGGDFYSFERAPIILTLAPGKTVLDVRLVRDVRAMGGENPPTLTVKLEVQLLEYNVEIPLGGLNFPDLVGNYLAGTHASVLVRNNGGDAIAVQAVSARQACPQLLAQNSDESSPQRKIHMKLSDMSPIRIAPGQSRSVTIKLCCGELENADLLLEVQYVVIGSTRYKPHMLRHKLFLKRRELHEPHKMTFLHSSGSVSYAIIRPPPKPSAGIGTNHRLPVLLNLHGAGLEADSFQVRHQLDSVSQIYAWTLFPTGMSPWSGDDWHTWGFADIKSAVSSIPQWIEAVHWNGPDVATDRWLVSGHSNGGQGTLFVGSHQPDKLVAAAPASGYLSIEQYVPYSMWSEADPMKSAILQVARSSFRHELLYNNLQNLPILVQHGSEDDNVPPFHSRLMHHLLSSSHPPAEYFELEGKGHWFEGAMETEPLREFYARHLSAEASLSTLYQDFSSVYPNSHDMGSRNGIEVDQLESPDRMGQIEVTIVRTDENIIWRLKTSNIRRLHLVVNVVLHSGVSCITLDDNHEVDISAIQAETSFVRLSNGGWALDNDSYWQTIGQRFGRQRGALDSILRTEAPFQIVTWAKKHSRLSLQISRNMLQYFGADSVLLDQEEYDQAVQHGGNVIIVVVGPKVPKPLLENFPLQIDLDGVYLDRPSPPRRQRFAFAPGLGAIYIRPLPDERLELVVWGIDEIGLRQAARLVPTLTGAGQPDFVVLDDAARWRGHAGALALGFFDHSWNISAASQID